MEHSFNVELAEEYGVNCALILNEICRKQIYFQRHEKNFHDGKTWVYYSSNALSEALPYLSQKKIKYSLSKLIDEGVLEKGNYNATKYDRTAWYSCVEQKVMLHFTKGNLPLDKMSHGKDERDQPIPLLPYSKSSKKKDTNKLVSKEKPLNDSDYGRYGEHLNVLLTEQEYDKLLNGWKGSAGYMLQTLLDAGIEKLSRYMASNGKKYKSHYATMQGWVWKDVMREYGINIEGWHSSKWKMPYWLRGDKEKINWFSFSEAEREEYYDNATLSGQIRCIEDALRSSGKWTPEMVWWETNGRRPENV